MPYTIVDVARGQLPEPGRFRALAVLGSSRSAYETGEPWIQAEHDFVRACIDAGTPVLGICFGAQLLALVLGGSVHRMAQPELGWYPISGDEPYGGTYFVWHGDEITVPPGSSLLASTPACTHAFANGRHLGVQYHPELTFEHIDFWISTPRRRQSIIDAGGDVEQIMDATPVLEPAAVAAAGRLYHRFFSVHVHLDSGVTPCPHASPAR
ncbi:type 1 glutamine amidotransferase [Mycobacterium sp. 21AC1]|uniref:type 1 glutamine amidotransferase n=1 Tax=[Mycobacterium] appelbergii TaxID=2939269 RepID=UPI0029390D88|nr:type 1 glutamine amidotransferase [Mycobacterium sp. 21AC1]MDV3126037.1 type 1 glutamine amidotransferase [Mycobacterium sp. 21AC1]